MRWIILCFVITACGTYQTAEQRREASANPPGTTYLKDKLYIDKTKIANVHWREYVFWTAREDSSNLEKVLPDTLVWRSEVSYNEPLVEYYFRHPSFNMYPAVGISYEQAVDFCKWRSDRVNEHIPHNPGKYKYKKVRYRLPTKEEWEYAASGGLDLELYPFGLEKIYDKKGRLQIFCDVYSKDTTKEIKLAYTKSLYPNGFGLYHTSGNLSEMVAEEGVAKGGNFLLPLDSCKVKTDHYYNKTEVWLGFRCICEIIE